ncbi:hypothetical protein [Pararhizobium sp.]|uniref:hypothetical protein n=1 Tax=Pararhizobium sp. TaxID=1977563 RepID=UPI002729348F|nr:hypothetical protein [Pararhizobium sp.]MDO9418575.1 hypothetical protein [Pararhizobium sp.]
MTRWFLMLLSVVFLSGCGGGMVKATSDLDRGFDKLGCLSRDFKGDAPCTPQGG